MPFYEVEAILTVKARLFLPANSLNQAKRKVEGATPRQVTAWTTSRTLLERVDASVVGVHKEDRDFV